MKERKNKEERCYSHPLICLLVWVILWPIVIVIKVITGILFGLLVSFNWARERSLKDQDWNKFDKRMSKMSYKFFKDEIKELKNECPECGKSK